MVGFRQALSRKGRAGYLQWWEVKNGIPMSERWQDGVQLAVDTATFLLRVPPLAVYDTETGWFWVMAVNFFLVAVWWKAGSLGWYLCELKPDGKRASQSEIKILGWHGNALNSAACGITSLVCYKGVLMDVGQMVGLEKWYYLFFSHLPVYVIYVSIQTKWQVSWWHFHTRWLGWLPCLHLPLVSIVFFPVPLSYLFSTLLSYSMLLLSSIPCLLF